MKILTEIDNSTMKIKCPMCSGTGIEEETTKGYRRYKCWSCEGEKVVDHPFGLEEESSPDGEDTQTPVIE